MCATGHPHICRDPLAFASATVRLRRFPNREVYQADGAGGWMWMRDCPTCRSTLYVPVKVTP